MTPAEVGLEIETALIQALIRQKTDEQGWWRSRASPDVLIIGLGASPKPDHWCQIAVNYDTADRLWRLHSHNRYTEWQPFAEFLATLADPKFRKRHGLTPLKVRA